MRIWDIYPSGLCRKHLLGEHRELHAVWSILTTRKKGYSNHPETKRWAGKLKALYRRHDLQVAELLKRGYSHNSPLEERLATGNGNQSVLLHTPEEQLKILAGKKCGCASDFC